MANHAQRNLLHAYLDDELDLVRSMELEDHLVECGDCARQQPLHGGEVFHCRARTEGRARQIHAGRRRCLGKNMGLGN